MTDRARLSIIRVIVQRGIAKSFTDEERLGEGSAYRTEMQKGAAYGEIVGFRNALTEVQRVLDRRRA
jgi:hypothetical protein